MPWGGSGFYRLHDGAIRITYEVDEAKRTVYILHLSVVPQPGSRDLTSMQWSSRFALQERVRWV